MKKFFSILLALLYLGTYNGLALQVHYCMDEIAGFSLGNTEEKGCGKCGMEKANDCCKDEVQFLKLNDSHKLQFATYQFQAPSAVLNHSFPFDIERDISFVRQITPVTNAPPEPFGPSLHLRYCVFRI